MKLKSKHKLDTRELLRKHPHAKSFIPETELLSLSVHTPETYDFYGEELLYAEPRQVGARKKLVMLYNFHNDPNNKPYSKSQIQTIWGKVDQFWRTASYGKSSLAVEVVDWFTVSIDNTANTNPEAEVKENARRLGYNVDSYSDFCFIYPTGGTVRLNGVTASSIDSTGNLVTSIYLAGYGGSLDTSIHEDGHSAGLKHSNGLTNCTTPPDGCTHIEYGGMDVMGHSYTMLQPNAAHKNFLGWLSDVGEVLTDGQYTLYNLETSGQQSAIKLARTWQFIQGGYSVTKVGFYYLEYRPTYGVILHLIPEYTSFKDIVQEDQTGTQLVKVITDSFYDSALGVNIKVLSAGATAEVLITFGPPPPDTTPPTVNITYPVNGQVLSGIVGGTATVSETSTVEWYAVGTNWQVLIGTGVSVTKDTREVPDGYYQIQAKATDPSGNFSWSGIIGVTVDNTTIITPTKGRGRNK